STVSFRGTSAGHTQVTWNGMPVNNPTIGSTDFSTIPAYFIDRASLLHGNSSLGTTSGGLGGLVQLASEPVKTDGFSLQYVQGAGSFSTFDEYLRASYGGERWRSSTRVVLSSSANDYTYTNHDKKENIYDSDHNIVASYHPRERNRSGAFRDFHALQDVYYRGSSNTAGASIWYLNSRRELPMLTTDYGDARDFSNVQREQTLRAVASWKHFATNATTELRAGYIHTTAHYDYSRDNGSGALVAMTRSRSIINSFYGHAGGEYRFPFGLSVEVAADLKQHRVRSYDDKIGTPSAAPAAIGYNVERSEFSAAVTARWRPVPRAGLAAIVREESNAGKWSPVMPALMVDAILWPRIGLSARASVARNYRYPAINDLYFMPGGNPDLRPEKGFSYDAGLELSGIRGSGWDVTAAASWFDSRI
ncbi:MAG: TonB-dependent receptor, partial [Muribaculaceae bacterium]|nr:TonB-dependent receptor [Muribaculaceae bacterium]